MKTWNYNGSTPGNWSTPANWTPAGVPGSPDDAIFNGTGVGNCLLDLAVMDANGWNQTSSYTGSITFANPTGALILQDGLTIEGGSFISNGARLAVHGAVIINTFGNFDVTGSTITAGSWNYILSNIYTLGNATIQIDGTGGALANIGQFIDAANTLICNGDSANTSDFTFLHWIIKTGKKHTIKSFTGNTLDKNFTITIEAGGLLTTDGVATHDLHPDLALDNTLNLDGTIQFLGSNLWVNGIATLTIVGNGVIDAPIQLSGGALGGGGGVITLDGNLTWKKNPVGSGDINCATYNPNLFLPDSFSIAGFTYQRGTGTIYATGSSGTQTLDFGGQTVEGIVVLSTGAIVKPLTNFACAFWNHVSGEVNHNGKNITTDAALGDFSIQDGAIVTANSLGGSTITVGRNFAARGHSGSLLDLTATAAWFLNVSGLANAQYVQAKNSNAAGGSIVHAFNSTDAAPGGTNTNWDFVSPPSASSVQFIVPNEGETRLLADMLAIGGTAGAETLEPWLLKLFTNFHVPVEGDVAATYTEATYTGYAAKTLARDSQAGHWTAPVSKVPHRGWSAESLVAESTYAPQTFTAGSIQAIQGYAIFGATSGKLIGAELFAFPYSIGPGNPLHLIPRLGGY